ncbi:dirigent protein 7 [Phtheirospermum japonicum]|uniref:Dirigent protein n=1 Tax=Phtheirospermum japonicum TaxID=374723 RepID=A0A830DBY1_9LAMI|nr:dirigent protein 7 [Phtheirospermum japonicum]
MANTLLNLSFFCISIFLSSIIYQANAESRDDLPDDLSVKLNHKHHKLTKQKLSEFHVYWHDIFSGSHPTAVTIIKSPTGAVTRTSFGQINMIDNLLTKWVDPRSEVVGRAQGLYAFDSLQTRSLLMTMNIVFTGEEYNGSTITILGSNPIFDQVREMPVIGGTGFFQNARGFATSVTWLRKKNKDSTVEYNVYVLI